MSTSKIKKELSTFDKKQLIDLIIDLSKKHKVVSDYLEYFVNPNETEQFEKYKKKVREAFYPRRGYDLKLQDGKKAISDFKKLDPSRALLAELMLYYVECGVAFTNDFGDIDEAFYDSIAKVYLRAMQLMKQEELLDNFQKKCSKIVDDTQNIGWGFHDYLVQVYYDYFPSDEDD